MYENFTRVGAYKKNLKIRFELCSVTFFSMQKFEVSQQVNGSSIIERNKTKQNKTKQNRTKQNKAKQNKMQFNKLDIFFID